jgi:hypothetical protein
MTEQQLICAIRESDRQWHENETQYTRRRQELSVQHHLLTLDLIELYKENGYSRNEIAEMIGSINKNG